MRTPAATHTDVVVVGSGFGGSTAALRLPLTVVRSSQAGAATPL